MQVISPITYEAFSDAFDALGKFTDNDKFAVAVSGGADSMALLRLLFQKVGQRLLAFTVEHGLRKESMAEAEWVHAECTKLNIPHKILVWQGEKPKTRIEERARQARYALLFEACRDEGVKYLCLAHNLGDNVETFLMRLCRSSGVDGLAAIRPVSERDGVTILRPLLNFSREQIVATNKDFGQTWVDDPSNWSDDFERVRWRKFMPTLAKMGLTPEAIAGAIKKQLAVANFLQKLCDDFSDEFSFVSPFGYGEINKEAFDILSKEQAVRILQKMLVQLGDDGYPPTEGQLMALLRKLKDDTLGGGVTLHGVKVKLVNKGKALQFVREESRVNTKITLSEGEKHIIFDRFKLSFGGQIPKGVWVAKLGHGFKFADKRLPKQVLWTIPAIWDKDGVLIVPHLGYYRGPKTDFDVKVTMIRK